MAHILLVEDGDIISEMLTAKLKMAPMLRRKRQTRQTA
jgi:hypothetical protein